MSGLLLTGVALAGGLGAVARWAVDALVVRLLPGSGLPWGILLVNVMGSFALGLLLAGGHEATVRVLGTGFCGAFTTFSTVFVALVVLLGRRRFGAAAGYLLLTLTACPAAAALGLSLLG